MNYNGLDMEALREICRQHGVVVPEGGCVPCEMNSALEGHFQYGHYTGAVLQAREVLREWIATHKRCKGCTIIVGAGHNVTRSKRGFCDWCIERHARIAERQVNQNVLVAA